MLMILFTSLIVKRLAQLLQLDIMPFETVFANLYLTVILVKHCNQTPIIEQKIAGTNLTCDILAKTSINCNDYIDVCIVNAAANTYIDKAAMDIRNKYKDQKYRKALRDSKIIFNIVPFIMELSEIIFSN